MAEACPIQTPEERARGAVVVDAVEKLLVTMIAAIESADADTRGKLRDLGEAKAPSFRKVFMANLHQNLFCLLCDADPETFAGGNAAIAAAIIGNNQQIAQRYWGAEIEVTPQAQGVRPQTIPLSPASPSSDPR